MWARTTSSTPFFIVNATMKCSATTSNVNDDYYFGVVNWALLRTLVDFNGAIRKGKF